MSQRILGCVYGSRHIPFIYTFLFSASNANYQVTLGYDQVPEFEIKLLKIAFPGVNFVELSHGLQDFSTHASRASNKVTFWRQLFEEQVSIDDEAIFMDIDTVLIQSPFHLFDSENELVVTRKVGRWPLNSGVLFVRKTINTLRFFESWESRTREILANKKLNKKAELDFGGADQSSLVQVLEIKNQIVDWNLNSHEIPKMGFAVKFVSCEFFNQTESSRLTPLTHIIHFKGGWHSILLDKSRYTRNRRRETSQEFHQIWRGYYSSSQRKLFENLNELMWKNKNLLEIISSVKYQNRGIWNSELALMVSLLSSLEIYKIIESGRARGHSTQIISKSMTHFEDFSLYSLDNSNNEDVQFGITQLKSHQKVHLHNGDANKLISEIIRNELNDETNYGVILDGPKSINALYLVCKLARRTNPPKLIFIHDMRRIENGIHPSFHRFMAGSLFERIFFSDEFDWNSGLVMLDKSVVEKSDTDEFQVNVPYYKNMLFTGSYGPTVAVILPTPSDSSALKKLLVFPIKLLIIQIVQLSKFILRSKLSSLRRLFRKGDV